MKNIKKSLVIFGILFGTAVAVSAQNIVFTSLGGDKIEVERDKVVVMAIGASWLPLSNAQAKTINKLARYYEGNDEVIFYFIATDSASRKSKNYASNDDIEKFVDTLSAA